MKRLLLVAATTVVVAATSAFAVPVELSSAHAAAPSARDGKCHAAEADGVTVVIDFQDLGGQTVIRCVTGVQNGTRGYAVLLAAGIGVAGTVHDGASFVCRLNGRPAQTEVISIPGNPAYTENCDKTPPATAYWSYWTAGPGGGWQYSDLGVQSSRVKLGGFEGWSFSLNRSEDTNPPPRVDPVPAPAPAPAPAPDPAPAPAPAPAPDPAPAPVPAPASPPGAQPGATGPSRPGAGTGSTGGSGSTNGSGSGSGSGSTNGSGSGSGSGSTNGSGSGSGSGSTNGSGSGNGPGAGSGSGSGSGTGATSADSGRTTAEAPNPSAPSAAASAGTVTGSASGTVASSSRSTSAAPSLTTTSSAGASGTTSTPPSTAATDPESFAGSGSAAVPAADEAGDGPWSVIGVVALLAALGGGIAFWSRRRTRSMS